MDYYVYFGHVMGGAERGKPVDGARFVMDDFDSLVFECNSEESANKCLESFRFSGRV